MISYHINICYFLQATETGKRGFFEKIVKKKVIKKTRKNEETRQKRMSIVAEKEALREARKVEKQVASLC